MSQPGPLVAPEGTSPDDAAFWEHFYHGEERPGWDLGKATPPLDEWFTSSTRLVPPAAIMVPGCGNGHDLAMLAARGFRVTGLDFAPSAIAGSRQTLGSRGLSADLVQGSLFDAGHGEDAAAFDAVVEHTCFCAIDPGRRRDYVDAVRRLLKPGGLHVGLFYHHGRPEGPPFNTTPDAVLHHFAPWFECLEFGVASTSVPRRLGFELLVVQRKK